MEDIMSAVSGVAGWLRDILMMVATFSAKYIPYPAENIFIVIVVLLSLFAASKLLSIVPTARDSTLFWLILAGVIFYVVSYS